MAEKINFWAELSNRWNENSPIFFRRLQNWGLTLTALSVSILGANEIPGLDIPEIIAKISGYLATAGGVLTFVAKLPVKDPDYKTLDK